MLLFCILRSFTPSLMPAIPASSHATLTHALRTPERPTFLYFPQHAVFFPTYTSSHMLSLLSGGFFLTSSGCLILFILYNKAYMSHLSEPSPPKKMICEIQFKTFSDQSVKNMGK